MAVSWELLVQLTPDLDTVYLRVCPTTRWHHFHDNESWGAYGCVKCIVGVFLAEKQGKIQPGVFLLFSQVS